MSIRARLLRATARLLLAVAVMAGLTAVCALPASADLRVEGMGPTADVSPAESAPPVTGTRDGILSILRQAPSPVMRPLGPATPGPAIPTVAQLWAGMTVRLADVLRTPAAPAEVATAPSLQAMVDAAIADMARSVPDRPAANERRLSMPVTP